jgi:hypothetical protein
MRTYAAALLTAVALGLAAPAAADDDDEARVRAACAGGRAELRLRTDSDDQTIEIELRVDSQKRVAWRIVLLHERTLVFQGVRNATGTGYSFRLRRTVQDWPGRETVTARIRTATGRTCRLAATI